MKTILIIGSICTAVILGVSIYVWLENHRAPLLEVYIFPLKSGQSIFIRTPSDKRILIDGGTNSEIIRDISAVLPFYTRRIDVIVVTRPDEKHVTGLIDVIDRYDVGQVLVPQFTLVNIGLASSSDQIYESFIGAADSKHIPLRQIAFGDATIFDDNAQVGFDVLFPVASSSFKYSKASAPELVGRISFGSTSILVAGSISTKIQKYIASSSTGYSSIKSDVLILSQNATPKTLVPTFTDAVAPDYIVYSKAPTKTPTTEEENHFNIREIGTLKIVSDRATIKIEKI